MAGIFGGFLAFYMKAGSEAMFPPMTPDRTSPPGGVFDWFGIDMSTLTYTFSQQSVNWGAMAFGVAFSVGVALVYCVIVEYIPRAAMWLGVLFGITVTIGFHGIVLPVFGLTPAAWNLPFDEIFSQTFGHIVWAVVIELARRQVMGDWRRARS